MISHRYGPILSLPATKSNLPQSLPILFRSFHSLESFTSISPPTPPSSPSPNHRDFSGSPTPRGAGGIPSKLKEPNKRLSLEMRSHAVRLLRRLPLQKGMFHQHLENCPISPPWWYVFEDDVPFPKMGYVRNSSLEGICSLTSRDPSLSHVLLFCSEIFSSPLCNLPGHAAFTLIDLGVKC